MEAQNSALPLSCPSLILLLCFCPWWRPIKATSAVPRSSNVPFSLPHRSCHLRLGDLGLGRKVQGDCLKFHLTLLDAYSLEQAFKTQRGPQCVGGWEASGSPRAQLFSLFSSRLLVLVIRTFINLIETKTVLVHTSIKIKLDQSNPRNRFRVY